MAIFDGRYEQLDLIGRGGFSEVWKVRDTQTGVILALKIYSPNKGVSDVGMEMLTREFALLSDANHQNLLRPSYFAICKDTSDQIHRNLPYLILPFCPKGNVSKQIGSFTEKEAWRLIRDTASALAYLHSMVPPIIHQDIKPENILINNDGTYLLSDFGVSIQARSTISRVSNTEDQMQSAGTISYMAPERFSRNNKPILANDIYSLGVMLFELLSGYLPFGNDGGLLQMKGAEIPELPGDYSDLLKRTIDDCLQAEPWKRPVASKLAEIADQALSKTPTIVMGHMGHEESEPIRTKIPFEEQHPFPIKKILVLIVTLLIIAVGGIFGYQYFSHQALEPETPQMPVIEEVTKKDDPPINEEETKINELPAPDVKKTANSETKEIVSTHTQEKAISKTPEKEPATLDLGYATWKGESMNGKPHGYGTMTYKSEHIIDSRDPQANIAQSGDKVEGNYSNGHLEYGTWIKSNGEKEQLFIGQ